MIERARKTGAFHLVLVVDPASDWNRSSQGPHTSRLQKVDFAAVGVESFARSSAPILEAAYREIDRWLGESIQGSELSSGATLSLVVIGASTGGPAAVRRVLEKLPASFPCPIALVQHIDTGYENGFAEWLNGTTALSVRLAKDGDAPRPGEVIVAPTEKHLVCRSRHFFLDDGPKVFSQKPAVDRLFTTAAEEFGREVVGVLLTGIGTDGGLGCQQIRLRGGLTLVQDEASSTVWGMPKAAFQLGAASRVLPLDEIGPQLIELAQIKAGV
jgi:chemotaxis response regulator CheB